ncbi:hypothetical protein COL154_013815 [Colletotrichum chrysophilum]|uniref:uncharacterized protein n=1 Tax=Colletotrichum chrysophilum TaxID=1836956 RepID=UPI0023004C54|nr:uncharacterized protein COL26b_013317 [Colletotrichum chrysophilum]KAJ0318180.1 hypothetical protein Brms1b_004432 [Colletotrichum noveboracense]KAJ0338183.1 hypothetical protein KNSL1_012532 [Colletotrichum chrysophilum]KAJ0347855.1 hypothetical protein COL154_013815 [Colletotrichum chrysophilum]KAJ0362462.1 hypothetical protein COL26b_013317 [Colletotrichum chrysophilum]
MVDMSDEIDLLGFPRQAEVNASTYLTFINRPHIAACIPCRQALRPDKAIETHFRRVHQLKGETLRSVVNLALSAACLAELEDPHACRTLSVLDGFSWVRCSFRTISRKLPTLRTQRTQHDSRSAAGLQTLSQGRYAPYWVVSPDSPEEEVGTGGGDGHDVLGDRLVSRQSIMAAEDERWGRIILTTGDIN